MAGAGLEFSLDGITGKLEQLQTVFTDLTPLMDRIGAALEMSAQMRFETKTGPGGQKWQDLAASTIRERIRKGYGGQNILRRSGDLVRSLNTRSAPDRVIVSLGGSGNSTAYARAQHMGATIKRSGVNVGGFIIKIPARPSLGIDREDEKEIVNITDRFLKEVLES